MAGITTSLCTSFKVEKMKAVHNFTNGSHVFKVALFKAGASLTGTYDVTTTNYSDMTGNSDETSGSGYSAGGAALTNVTPVAVGVAAVCDFSDLTFSSVSITTRGFMIYNSSASNKAVCVVDFGADKVISAANFTIVWPTPDATNAIVREN